MFEDGGVLRRHVLLQQRMAQQGAVPEAGHPLYRGTALRKDGRPLLVPLLLELEDALRHLVVDALQLRLQRLHAPERVLHGRRH
jgi:hypothetical protein